MTSNTFKIGVVCASSRFSKERAEAVEAWFADAPVDDVRLYHHNANSWRAHGTVRG